MTGHRIERSLDRGRRPGRQHRAEVGRGAAPALQGLLDPLTGPNSTDACQQTGGCIDEVLFTDPADGEPNVQTVHPTWPLLATDAEGRRTRTEGDLLVVGWGSTKGAIEEAVDRVIAGPERKSRVMSEEERRLMYVALTRARRRLYLSFAQSRMLHGQTRYGIPSRFLHEIPEALMKRVGPRFNVQSSMFKVSGSVADAGRSGTTTLNFEPGTLNGPHGTQWRVGQSVVHPRFGAGVIVNAEGHGADARVLVNFRSGGLKWLVLEYAKLAPA